MADVWTRAERQVARKERLHREFSRAITTSRLDGRRHRAEARRWKQRCAREGSEKPRYRTIGQWWPGGRAPRPPRAGRQSALDRR